MHGVDRRFGSGHCMGGINTPTHSPFRPLYSPRTRQAMVPGNYMARGQYGPEAPLQQAIIDGVESLVRYAPPVVKDKLKDRLAKLRVYLNDGVTLYSRQAGKLEQDLDSIQSAIQTMIPDPRAVVVSDQIRDYLYPGEMMHRSLTEANGVVPVSPM